MRLKKEVTIEISETESKTFTVLEIRPKDIVKIYQDVAKEKDSVDFKTILEQRTIPLLTNATPDQLADLFPSEMDQLYEAFKEVNGPFLKRLLPLLKTAEAKELLKNFQNTILSDFLQTYAGLSSTGTETP